MISETPRAQQPKKKRTSIWTKSSSREFILNGLLGSVGEPELCYKKDIGTNLECNSTFCANSETEDHDAGVKCRDRTTTDSKNV